jgi:cystathionine gamma-synthase
MKAVNQKLAIEDKMCFLYLNPIMWTYTASHTQNKFRKEFAISSEKLTFKVVDINPDGHRHRLYAVLFAPQDMMALKLSWGTPGLGLSIREAEFLLSQADTMTEVPFDNASEPPTPTFTPEVVEHQLLRQRIVDLIQHGAIDPPKIQCQGKDVFLYPSGMAAIFYSKNILQDYRPDGVNVILGVVFYSTDELLQEESRNGYKHFGRVDKKALDEFEAWLESNTASYAIIETPGNPTLEFPDLKRVKQLVSRNAETPVTAFF